MQFEEIANYRMISQQLFSPRKMSVAEMVTWLGAVQAQEYGPTKWGLGIRLPHVVDKDIEKDFTEGKILRTHLLRPTWHFVAAKDIRWLLNLTEPRVTAANAYMYRKLELDETVFKKCNTLLEHSLKGGKQLSRPALNEIFKSNKIHAEGHRLSYIMMQAELKGILCSGAREGNEFTYALLEERVAAVKTKDREEALAELSLRYFNSRGPATLKDFSTWSGLTLTDCRKGIELVGKELKEEKIGEEIYYFNESILAHQKITKDFYLLPLYDELIMGYKDRSPMMLYRERTKSKTLLYDNMIVSEGQIIGGWKREIKPKSIHVEYSFLQKPSAEQVKAFEKSLARYKEFTGLAVDW